MEEFKGNLGIKSWAEEDRPREKLMLKGKSVLSEAELIAILIGSGSKNESAIDLAKRILISVHNNLNELGRLTINDLMKFKGIGEAKAISIIAALELGRRRREKEGLKRGKIMSSADIYEVMQPIADLHYEEFWILLLNRSNRIIGKYNISKGGVNGTVTDSRIIFKFAIENLASSIVLCHNHPSGNYDPSDEDVKLTKKLRESGNIMDIPVVDHVIIANGGYYSFADEGIL